MTLTHLHISSRRPALALAAFLLASAAATSSVQAGELVTNGGFENLLQPGVSAEFGSRHPSQQVTSWTTGGYNFVYTPGTADTTGAIGEYDIVSLWGPGNGSNNGLPATSPSGGNFLAMNGVFNVGAVSQTLTGLMPGEAVTVSFDWAGAQQKNYNGATTEQFEVSLGDEMMSTAVLNNANHGFTGWQHESFTFHPTSTSEVLSFLAVGTPAGEPPFSLLDGVSAVTGTPEPATWALFGLSLAGAAAAVRARRRKS